MKFNKFIGVISIVLLKISLCPAGTLNLDVIDCFLIFRDLVPTATLTENLTNFYNHIENNADGVDDTLVLASINDALMIVEQEQESTDKKIYQVVKNILEQLKDRLTIEATGIAATKAVSAFGYVWTTQSATIPVQTNPPNGQAAITFTNSVTSGGITFDPNNGKNVVLPSAGFYSVTWSVSGGSSGTSTDNAFGVYFNNVSLPGSVLLPGSYYETIIPGTVYPTNGQLIFQASAGGTLTLQNVLANFQGVLTTSGNTSATNLATGLPANNVTASMLIIKLN